MKAKRINPPQVPRVENARHTPNADGECFLCSRPVIEARCMWVQMSYGAELIAVAEGQPDDSQGWFPIGPRCTKLIPAAYKTRTI